MIAMSMAIYSGEIYDIPNPEQGDESKRVEAPLVRGCNKASHEPSDDHHPREEHRGQDIGHSKAS